MNINGVLRWIIIAIVIIVAINIVNVLLGVLGSLLSYTLPLLVAFLVVAIVLRFGGMLLSRCRR